jgi:hypothetical protein
VYVLVNIGILTAQAHHLILLSLKEVSTWAHNNLLIIIKQPEPLHRQCWVGPAPLQDLSRPHPSQRCPANHDGGVGNHGLHGKMETTGFQTATGCAPS